MKAGSGISGNDLGGLRKLRSALGDKFIGGIVLNTGERLYSQDDRIYVPPTDLLWIPSSAFPQTTVLIPTEGAHRPAVSIVRDHSGNADCT